MRLRADSATGYRFTAIATLSAAAAGLTLLAGLLDLQLFRLTVTPLIHATDVPAPTWSNTWLSAARPAPMMQAEAIREWLQVIAMLLSSILLIAGISALVALFAHATARRYEVALSAVVGASRSQLRNVQLRMAAMNATVAVLIGVSVGLLSALVANRTWPASASPIAPAGWLAFSVVFCGGLAAFVAYRVAARMSHTGWMGDVLSPEARTNPGFGAEDLRNVLLHLQFAVTFAILATAILVWQHAHTKAGIREAPRANDMYVTRIELPAHATASQRRALLDQLHKEATFATPGALLGVGTADRVLANCGRCEMAYMPLSIYPVLTQQHVVGKSFFSAIGFMPHTGREFEDRDANRRNVVVNDTFALLAFQGRQPIGKQIQVGGLRGDWYTVVGVIPDVPVTGLTSFIPNNQGPVRSHIAGREAAIYFFAGEKPPTIVDVISRDPVKVSMAGITIRNRSTMRDMYEDARAPSRWFGGVLGALAVAAAIVATLSLGAITLLNVRQRELEIAARRAVGARRRDILRLVIAANAAVIARGTFVGIILSVGLANTVRMMLPHMHVFDVVVIGVAALVLGTVSLLAAIIPARAAASVAPAQIHA